MDPNTQTDPANPPVDPAVIAATDPANPPPADPAAAPAATDPADPQPAPQEDPQHGNKGKKPWFLDRISEESEGRRREKERADAAEALLRQMQSGEQNPAATRQPVAAPQGGDEAAVEARARALVAQQQIGRVISEGISKFADWDDRAAVLGSAGAASPDFVLDVIGVDPGNAHVILHQLADDPAKAARLAKMDSRSRTIELVKMSLGAQPGSGTTQSKPAEPARQVSKAPAPAPAVQPTGGQPVDWRSDKASDDEFSKGWDKKMEERAKRGRR